MTHDPIQSWLNAAGRFPLLPKGEMIRLAKKRDTLQPGSRAYLKVVNKMCQHNLRLVPGVVRTHLSKRPGFKMTSEVAADLLQQGYFGLRRAAEKYDGTRGYKFSTYAYSWISQAITRWHNSHDRMIYIPENTMVEMLYRRRNGKPSSGKNGRMKQELLDCCASSLSITSLDQKLGDSHDDDVHTLSDVMCDENRIIDPVSSEVSEAHAEQKLRNLMNECGIKRRDQEIVVAYTKRPRMSIIAAKMSLSPKHCQNLYSEAIRTIRARLELAGKLGK